MQFLIIENMEYYAVIGTDELDRNNVIIDYLKGQIQIENEFIKFEKDEKQQFGEEKHKKNNNMMEISKKNSIECDVIWRDKIEEILQKYKRITTKEDKVAKDYVHHIEVKGIDNFRSKTYLIPYKYKNEVAEKINKMLENGIIEKCNSRFINPIVVVKKNVSRCKKYK